MLFSLLRLLERNKKTKTCPSFVIHRTSFNYRVLQAAVTEVHFLKIVKTDRIRQRSQLMKLCALRLLRIYYLHLETQSKLHHCVCFFNLFLKAEANKTIMQNEILFFLQVFRWRSTQLPTFVSFKKCQVLFHLKITSSHVEGLWFTCPKLTIHVLNTWFNFTKKWLYCFE